MRGVSTFEMLLQGFQATLTPECLLAAAVGVTLGTIAGILPGLGISGTIALLLPISVRLSPLTALIMFCGIAYGAMYGGSTTSILVNVPGEATSVVTCIEGYQMARRGRAGAALAVSAIGSFVAGTLGVVGLTFFAPRLASAALAFGPPEYFAIAFLGLVVLSNLSGTSFLRSFLMVLVGILLGTIGLDPMSAIQRFTFGIDELGGGIDFIIMVMGLFGLGEVLDTISRPADESTVQQFRFRDLYPSRAELRRSAAPIVRGSVLGFFMGLIPGPSATISTFLSYALERRIGRPPEPWGEGVIEGVAGPEAANNSASSAQMIPLLSLGIPFTSSTAVIMSGFMVHGIAPGPLLVTSQPELFWGLVASMYIGNAMLLILNLPAVGLFASLLKIPLRILMPVVCIIIFIGGYALSYNLADLATLFVFGILGYFMKLAKYDMASLAIGLFLGPMLEKGLVQGLIICDGSFAILFSRPLAGTFLWLAVAIIAWGIARWGWGLVRGPRATATGA
jgi:putative tricarboxylic transport membrane protein